MKKAFKLIFFLSVVTGCEQGEDAESAPAGTADHSACIAASGNESILIPSETGNHTDLSAVLAGSGIWLSWTDSFGVYTRQYGCDGEARTDPISLSPSTTQSVSAAVSGGTMMQLWRNQHSPHLQFQRFETDGTLIDASPQSLELALSSDSEPVWAGYTFLTPLPGGNFGMVGLYQEFDSSSVEPFFVQIDGDGQPISELIHPVTTGGPSSSFSQFTATPDGTVHIGVISSTGSTWHSGGIHSIPPDDPGGTAQQIGDGSRSIVSISSNNGGTWFILDDGQLGMIEGTESPTLIDQHLTGEVLTLSVGEEHVLVASMSEFSYSGASLSVQRFQITDDNLTAVGEARTVADDALIGAESLVWISDELWFVAWTSGAGELPQVRGRFITL